MAFLFGRKTRSDTVTDALFVPTEFVTFMDELEEMKSRRQLFVPALARVLSECDHAVHEEHGSTWTIYIHVGLPPDQQPRRWTGWDLSLSDKSDKTYIGSYVKRYEELRCVKALDMAVVNIMYGRYAGAQMRLFISPKDGARLVFSFEDYLAQTPIIVPDWIVPHRPANSSAPATLTIQGTNSLPLPEQDDAPKDQSPIVESASSSN